MKERFPKAGSYCAAAAVGAVLGAAAGVIITGNFFTDGKKIRRRIEADYAVGDDAFVRSVGQLLGPPLIDGNQVGALHNGAEIFPAMLEAIASAQRTITFENFVLASGKIARRFADALAARARAGVRVHLLQDALGCNCLRGAEMDLMRRAGVEIEVYRFLHLTRMNQRTHRKILVVDGCVGFTGGVGIADVWDGHGEQPREWRDSHYCLRGPAVGQMQQAFMDNWMMTRAEVLHGDDYFPPVPRAGDQLCQVFKSSADEGSDSARIMVMLSIAAARTTIQIANAYFLPDDLTVETLIKARERGVVVEVVVPGPLIDTPWVREVSRARWRPLLESGVRFFEYQPTNFHCKYMIVDNCWVSVGSTNLDNRSLRLNEECNLNVLDREFAQRHIKTFERDKERSREITFDLWKHRPMVEKIRGNLGRVLRAQM